MELEGYQEMHYAYKLRIRRAKTSEKEILTNIALRAKQSIGYDDSFMDACREELTVTASNMEEGEYWVAEHEVICGFVCFFDGIESNVGEIHSFFIDPDWQRRGVGRRLWLNIFEQAQSKGVKRIYLDADPAAVAFYKAIGFETIGRVPSGSIQGRFLPRMERKIVSGDLI